MSYIVFKPPPLQHIVLVTICTELWNQRDIWSKLQNVVPVNVFGLHVYPICLRPTSADVEDTVREKISALRLPELLRKLVLEFSRSVGIEFDKWLAKHRVGEDEILFQNHFPERLCWSARGCIDYKKTAELLVKDENLSLRDRYQIACINCLEEDIRRLIERMPEDEIKALIDTRTGKGSTNQTLMIFWARVLNEVADVDIFIRKNGNTFYQNAYYNATLDHNQAASSYFFEKLNQTEKDQILVEPMPNLCEPPFDYLNEIVFYLSRVSEVKQERFLQRWLAETLECLLDWQWQTMFMENVKRLWRFINRRHYAGLMHYLSEKILSSFHEYRYFDYVEMYQELYLRSPTYYKNYLLNDDIVRCLFEAERNELMALIVNGASDQQKQRLNNSRDCRIDLISILIDDSVVSQETLILCRKKFELEWAIERDEKESLTRPSTDKHLLFLMVNCMVELSEIGTGIICYSLMSAEDFEI